MAEAELNIRQDDDDDDENVGFKLFGLYCNTGGWLVLVKRRTLT